MSEDHTSLDRPLWLAIILIVAVMVASAGALMFHMFGATATDMLTGAGTAFMATVTLGMAMRSFLTD